MKYTLLVYAVCWTACAALRPDLWPIALFGFLQNVAFTFTSRARNSPSVLYHGLASLFSNGIYAGLLVGSINLAPSGDAWTFVLVYTTSTMSGAIWAHQLALKKEKRWIKPSSS